MLTYHQTSISGNIMYIKLVQLNVTLIDYLTNILSFGCYSYSYDLTHSLQCQMRTYPGSAPPPCQKFVWNEHMLEFLEGRIHSRWVLRIVCGFVSQIST